jgi:hypothetical protein
MVRMQSEVAKTKKEEAAKHQEVIPKIVKRMQERVKIRQVLKMADLQ